MGLSWGQEPMTQRSIAAGQAFGAGLRQQQENRNRLEQIQAQQQADLEKQRALRADEGVEAIGPVTGLFKKDPELAKKYGVQFNDLGEPQVSGDYARGFVKNGLHQKFMSESQQLQQSSGIATGFDTIANAPDASDFTKTMAKSHAQALKSGVMSPQIGIEMMRELQQQYLMDRNANEMKGVQPGIDPSTLDGGPEGRGPLATDIRIDSKGLSKPHVGPANNTQIFNAHVRRAQTTAQKGLAGVATPEDAAAYNRSVEYINTVHESIRTPDMVQVPRGGFPMEFPSAPKAKTLKPGDSLPNTGGIVPSHTSEAAREPGQISVKLPPEQGGMPVGKYRYEGGYQVFNPPPVQRPEGSIGSYSPARMPAHEIEMARAAEFAVNTLRNLSDAAEDLKLSQKDRSRLAMKLAVPDVVGKVPIVGGALSTMSQTSPQLAVDPNIAAIQTQLRHAQLRYENAMGGVRAAGSPQMYPIFQKLIPDVSDVNMPSKFRALADELQTAALTHQRMMSDGRYQAVPLRFRPETESKPRDTSERQGRGTAPASADPAMKPTAGVSGTSTPRPPLSTFQR